MIKPIRPGKLRGLTDDQIAIKLTSHFGEETEYFRGTIKVYRSDIKDGDDLAYIPSGIKEKLAVVVKRIYVGCDAHGPFLGIELNDEAQRIIQDKPLSQEET